MADYAVIRISDPFKSRVGYGLIAQRDRLLEWGKANGARWGRWRSRRTKDMPPDFEIPYGFAVDAGKSAYYGDFASRPGSGALAKMLMRGDRVVVTRIDRIWRRMRDFCNTVEWMQRNGINLVVLEPNIDFSKATGRLLAHILVAFAEFESAIKGERVKAAKAAKMARIAAGETAATPIRRREHAIWQPAEFTPLPKDAETETACGRVFVYTRCSDVSSEKSGLGLEDQAASGIREAERLIAANGNLVFGGVLCDRSVSAYRVPFRQREQGKLLDSMLRSGDIVVFPRIDRGFRSTRDMLNTVPDWIARGVTLKIVDQELDLSSWTGMVTLEALTLAAKIESSLLSARMRDVHNIIRSQGRFGLGIRTMFFFDKIEYRRNGKLYRRMVWNRRRLAAARCIRWLYKHCGLTQREAIQRTENLLAKRENRRPMNVCGESRRHKRRSALQNEKLEYPALSYYTGVVLMQRLDVVLKAWYASRRGNEAMLESVYGVKDDGVSQQASAASSSASSGALALPHG